jgi:predicted DNA-binding transcriptional regulator AlpA
MHSDAINMLSMAGIQAALKIKSRSTIYAMLARNELPPPCIINRRGLRWRERDIADWINMLDQRS